MDLNTWIALAVLVDLYAWWELRAFRIETSPPTIDGRLDAGEEAESRRPERGREGAAR